MNEDSVIVSALKKLKSNNIRANIVLKDKKFYNGSILLIDKDFVQIEDRLVGKVVISITDISIVRESIVGDWGGETWTQQ